MPKAFAQRSCYPLNLDQIPRMDSGACVVTCNLLNIPKLVLDPDQRDTLFPPFTPNQDVRLNRSGGCIPTFLPAAPPGGLVEIGSTNVTTQVTALTDTWERTNNTNAAVKLKVTTFVRIALDSTAGKLYAFFRTTEYDTCNMPIRTSAETRVEIALFEPCP